MTKLRSLKATGFRGARFELPLEFTKKHRSLAVYGENAAGKSTITDALEWFIRDRIEHLWKEDCKLDALRHVKCEDGDASIVEVVFDGADQNGSKSLSAALKTSTAYGHPDVATLLEDLKGDRIILRHADIVGFLDETKGRKREAIARIIGFDEIIQFRSVIQQSRNALQKDGSYTGAKQQSESLQSAMIESVGQVVPNRVAFFEIAKGFVDPFNIPTEIVDKTSYKKAVDELRGLGNSAEKIKAAQRLNLLEQLCKDLQTDLEQVTDKLKGFSEGYNALANERENVNKLRLSEFLVKGKTVIDDEAFIKDECPFCLSDYKLEDLQAEVAQRITALGELQDKLDECGESKDDLLSAITDAGTKANMVVSDYSDLADFKVLVNSAKTTYQSLRDGYKAVKAAFETLAVFEPPEGFADAIADLNDKCEASATAAQEAAKKLELTEIEKQIAEVLTTLQTVDGQVKSYETCQRTIEAFEAQILTLSTIFDEFVKVQNEALQTVLDMISADVGKFYQKLHPKESVDNVHLSLVGEEGVEFEYSFHGQATQPPRKYLSESHLNSLGVVLFLANARIFNKQARFLVLDDIVTSFDINHRRRLLRLLKEEFSDWQILILTHENVWFDLIKREMAPSGWLFHEVSADNENGILLENSPATMRALIDQKKGKEDVTNDLRKLLEAILKDVCYALEVKVAFRFNEVNEKRMPEELLSQLRSTLKEKSPDLAKDAVFAELAGSTLIANLDSHDNPEKVVGGDIDVLLEDIDKLVNLFVCDGCNRIARASAPVAGAKAISCRCGKLQIPWKI
ncbi:AAA family ATPase [Aliiroseovarius crassostreae]|uniref:AAA family ATPase n=1 Tax=Aliiroseovarius crassostreae TaxID=154981 RepID=UPI00220E392C|nr:AAA family ATPase [Aliiroseovarius crassostreae]UWQ09682.1 AAA family ATPase [Aliiroseovarius crassostreae]